MATRIEPTEDTPYPLPPCGGAWARDDDGGLRPLDAETAERAGLSLTAETEQPTPARASRKAAAGAAN